MLLVHAGMKICVRDEVNAQNDVVIINKLVVYWLRKKSARTLAIAMCGSVRSVSFHGRLVVF